jgi:hypothetical protein
MPGIKPGMTESTAIWELNKRRLADARRQVLRGPFTLRSFPRKRESRQTEMPII